GPGGNLAALRRERQWKNNRSAGSQPSSLAGSILPIISTQVTFLIARPQTWTEGEVELVTHKKFKGGRLMPWGKGPIAQVRRLNATGGNRWAAACPSIMRMPQRNFSGLNFPQTHKQDCFHLWLGAGLGDCAFSITARHKLKNVRMMIGTIGPLELAGLAATYASTSRTRSVSV